MTIIPEPTEIEERTREIGERAEDSTRRVAAAIAGALDGLNQALDEYDLAEDAREAAHHAGDITRAAAAESRTQAQTPEMQQLGTQLRAARAATTGYVGGKTESMRESIHDAREAVGHIKEDVKVRGQALAESGRRARVAPGRIRREIMAAFDSWKHGLVTALAVFGAIVVAGSIALIVLTVALVVWMNELVGDPAGTFIVAGIYVLVALGAYGVGRTARSRASEETETRMNNAREEARRVTRPLKRAFRGRSI